MRSDVLTFTDVLDEPLYQLVRQQLLAHELEKAGAEGTQRVRVVHVSPAGNDAYQTSLARNRTGSSAATVTDVWQRLLRASDRFVSVDSSTFWNPEVTSREYLSRYADVVIRCLQDFLDAFGVTDTFALEDALDVEGDVQLFDEGFDVLAGCEGIGLSYPFTLAEVLDVTGDL